MNPNFQHGYLQEKKAGLSSAQVSECSHLIASAAVKNKLKVSAILAHPIMSEVTILLCILIEFFKGHITILKGFYCSMYRYLINVQH